MDEVSELWQALPGDVIGIPGHFAGALTVLSLTWDDPDHRWLEWVSSRGRGSERFVARARISLVSRQAQIRHVSGEFGTDDDALAALKAALEETATA